MTELCIGDFVEAIPPWALVCGSGRYDRAVVVSVKPFIMVSEQADMLWSRANPDEVKMIGKAPFEVLKKAMTRIGLV